MNSSEPGPDLETDREDGARGSLEALPTPTRPDGRVGRSLLRLRVLRIVLIVFALGLSVIVAWSILSRRPDRAPVAPARTITPGEDDAIQTIEKFKFTSTLSGKPDYAIVADRLIGIAGGLHKLEGIRSIQIMRPDGTVLTGSADRGSFVEAESTQGPSGTVLLEGHVHIEGSSGERFDSERIEYIQKDGRIVSPGPVTFRLPMGTSESTRPIVSPGSASSRQPTRVDPASTHPAATGPQSLTGTSGRLEYEMSSHRLSLAEGVDLTIEEPEGASTRVLSQTANADMKSAWADFEGQVSLVREGDSLRAPTVHIERFPTGGQRLIARPGARARILEAASKTTPLGGGSQSGERTAPAAPLVASAERLEISETPRSRERTVILGGAARIEEERVTGAPSGRTIESDEIRIQDSGGAEGRRLHAQGNVRVLFPPGPGEAEPRRLTCRTLEALSGPGGKLSRTDAAGGVTIRGGDRVATSERMTLFDETRAELRGSRPKLEEPQRTLVANEIDLLSEPRRVEGRGIVRARFVPGERSAAGPFEPGQPVNVASEKAVLTEQPSRGEFQGKVVARQGERALTTTRLILDDAQQTVTAEGGVSLRTFREETSRTSATTEAGPAQARGATTASPPARGEEALARGTSSPARLAAVRVPVQIDGDSLFYDGARKSARFEGHAIYREPGRRLSADRITTTGSSADRGAGRPDEVVAEGHVILEGEGKRGLADIAHYRSDQRAVTLEGRVRHAELTDVATGRTWRGPALTWVLTPDSIPVVTGDSGRSRIVGSATGPGQDRVGKNADRPRSR